MNAPERVLEPDGYALLEAAGIRCPARAFVRTTADAASLDLSAFHGDRVVLKAISPAIPHKSEHGAVQIVPRDVGEVRTHVEAMLRRFARPDLRGVLVVEFVPHDSGPEGELLAGIRWTHAFGPLLTIGVGGVRAEFYARELRPDRGMAVLSPASPRDEAIADASRAAAVRLLTEPHRGRPAALPRPLFERAVDALLELAVRMAAAGLTEIEINPLAVTRDGLVALDVLGTRGVAAGMARPRPMRRMRALLQPSSAAIVGVSDRGMNPGRVILQNLLRDGFDASRLWVVKPGCETLDGCRCVDGVGDLPRAVDLLVLAVSAEQAPAVLREVCTTERAESVIVIPGGLEEKAGSGETVAAMHAALDLARASTWGGPLIVGGNCLGVRSVPGRYDTLFIPGWKLPLPPGPPAPLALVSQSGAFAIARVSTWDTINPRYVITTGNQMDATIGDFMHALEGDDAVKVFGVYVEGFRPLDGLRFLEAARRIVGAGRTVVLYQAGRTPAGAQASASHTASVAGDAVVTEALCRAAGVIMARSIEEFDDLVRLSARLSEKQVAGLRVGAVSNAGFECVAIADSIGALELASFSPSTSGRLQEIFRRTRIAGLVDVHNPLDLTPMAGDGAYEAAVHAVLDDPGVDLGVIGCVPLTAALETLAPGVGHEEDVHAPGGVARRLAALLARSPKPCVAIVDSGPLYDPMTRVFDAAGVPVFRSADRALRALDTWCAARIRTKNRASAPSPAPAA